MPRLPILPATLCFVAALGACGPRAASNAEAPAAEATPRQHITVLNSDILVIDGKHYRVSNISAPQPIPDAKCWAEALAAKQATRSVKAMVDRALSVTIEPTGGVDKYERTLARILLDGADLGQLLYDEGLAARGKKERFGWCEPVSRNETGAPSVFSLMELTPGRAAGE